MGSPDTTKIKQPRKDAATQRWFNEKYFKKPGEVKKPVDNSTAVPRKNDDTKKWFDDTYFKKPSKLVPKAQQGNQLLKKYAGDNVDWWKSWQESQGQSETPSYLQTPGDSSSFRMKGFTPAPVLTSPITPSSVRTPATAQSVTAAPKRVPVSFDSTLALRLKEDVMKRAAFPADDPNQLRKPRDGKGNFLTEDTSGKYIPEGPEKFLIKDKRQMPNLRPIPDILNYALARKSLNKQRDIELGRKNTYFTAPSLSVRPVQDLPPAVLAAQEQARARVRSEYAGSDPAMNMISKNMAGAQRTELESQQTAMREQAIRADQGRFDEQIRQNQLSSAETANKNLEREQDFADYKTGVRGAHERSMADLNKTALEAVGKNWDTASEYNLGQDANRDKNIRTEYEDKLAMAATATTWADKQKGYEKAKEWYEAAKNDPAAYAAPKLPNYKQAQMAAFNNSWLKKFLTR